MNNHPALPISPAHRGRRAAGAGAGGGVRRRLRPGGLARVGAAPGRPAPGPRHPAAQGACPCKGTALPVGLLLAVLQQSWLQQRQWPQPGMAAPIGPTRPPAPALQVDAAFADDMITTCQHLLEDAEVRVRWAVSAAAAADAAAAAHAVSLLTLPADWTAQYVSWAACPQRGRFAHTLLLPSCSLPSPHCCPALRCSIIVLAGGRAAAHAVPAAGHYGVGADAGLPAGVHHPQL